MEQFILKEGRQLKSEEPLMRYKGLTQGEDLFFAICKDRTRTKDRFGEQQVLPKYGEITF